MDTSTHRNGCHNRYELGGERIVQDGYSDRSPITGAHPRNERRIVVPHVLSTDCQYTHSDAGRVDKGCNGCRWRADDGIGC